MIFLSGGVIVFLIVEAILLLLLVVALYHVIAILRGWDFDATTPQQYALEKRAYLAQLIMLFALAFKILLLPYFAYMSDALSLLVPGAMCAAGVLGSSSVGPWLLALKVGIVFCIGLWMLLNREDLRSKAYPFLRLKFRIFLFLFALIVLESVLDLRYFATIVTETPVSCCSSIYGISGGESPIPFGLDTTAILLLFYLFYALSAVSALYRMALFSFVSNLLFLYTSYYAVVYFFGTYVYELPTHLCPFCMLQHHYYYIGFLIWGTLFAGTFHGLAAPLMQSLHVKSVRAIYLRSLFANTLFMLICSLTVLRYYLLNGVWL